MIKQRKAISSRGDEVTRSRLLQSLGIQKPSLSHHRRGEIAHQIAILPRRPASINLLSADKPIRLSFNDSRNYKWEQMFTTRTRNSNRRKRLVRFNSDGMEKPIASHTNYSNSIKSQLWQER